MARDRSGRVAVVLGGTQGIGKELVKSLVAQGSTVYLSGRTMESARRAVAEVGGDSHPLALDLSEPAALGSALAGVPHVDDLVIGAIERDANSIKEYSVERALRLVTLKLVGYTEAIHQLLDRFGPEASVVLFGGLALERPYPGSTTVSTVNGGVVGMVHSLSCELAPVRVNAVHPGIVGDSPYWEDKDNSGIVSRTPLGRLVTMGEIVDAVVFLLDNQGVNGVNLAVDGGWLRK